MQSFFNTVYKPLGLRTWGKLKNYMVNLQKVIIVLGIMLSTSECDDFSLSVTDRGVLTAHFSKQVDFL